jgi:gamma-glutamyl:cysteine ligase YbdK (ATP-grasp superfamily)
VLLALSVNSPFWQGRDSSYASFRYQAGPLAELGAHRHEARQWRQGRPVWQVRTELLRLAAWRTSRSGLDDVLVHPASGRPEPSAAVANLLLEHVDDALADAGEIDTVTDLLAAVIKRGNGAAFRRNAYRRCGQLPSVGLAPLRPRHADRSAPQKVLFFLLAQLAVIP